MNNIRDDRGYNQVWAPSEATDVRAERRCDLIAALMREDPRETVLEIGCGTGKNAYLIAAKTQKDTVAADVCAPFVAAAAETYQRGNLRYEVRDFSKTTDFQPGSFDYVIGNGILHHLYQHLDESLARMRELLKPNGRIIFMEPNLLNPYCYCIFSYSPLRKLARLDPDEMAFSKPFAEAMLARAGYRNICVQYRDFLLPGIPRVLIKPSIAAGAVFEKLPGFRMLAQSLLISADK